VKEGKRQYSLSAPQPVLFKFQGTERYSALVPTQLSRADMTWGLFRMKEQSANLDRPEVLDPATSQVGLVKGDFRIGNGLSGLGMTVQSAPFFEDMRVHVETTRGDALKAWGGIAQVVGGILSRDPQTRAWTLKPNYAEIEKRALKALDYFGLQFSQDSPNGTRERLKWLVLHGLSHEQWTAAIDGTLTIPSSACPAAITKQVESVLSHIKASARGAQLDTVANFPDPLVFSISIQNHLSLVIQLKDKNGENIFIG